MTLSFFESVWGPLDGLYGELRLIGGKAVGQEWWNSAETIIERATEYDHQGIDCYFGVLPRVRKRGRAEDCVQRTHVLWLDLDAKGFGESKARALAAVSRLDVHPSIIVDSGHGYHAYFLLKKDVPFPNAQKVMKGLVASSGADPKAIDAPRILRIPGTHNHKERQAVPVRLLYFDPGNRHYLSDFGQYVKPVEERVKASGSIGEGDILDAFQRAGIALKTVGSVYMTNCPWHDDSDPSLAIYPDTESFYCFGCTSWGTAPDVEKWVEDGTQPPRKAA